ncbi:MAG: glutathione S-transferase family protein [Gammaproteobacteria bacterium]
MSDQPYLLYGAYASYYTAKVRCYLRKKGIPFAERLPSDPTFREVVRPTSGNHRIPQILAPDGEVIQDSVAIVDALEKVFPDVPAHPSTPCQRLFVHLMELLGSEGLITLAWKHRWLFEENIPFITRDFGRTFQPQGDDQALMKYGQLIADRMTSYGLPEMTPDVQQTLDRQYIALLDRLEAHFIDHPYLLGGHPSQADYSIMGALHAHMGRDPAGLRQLQLHGPRTFRWVEHMLTPEIQSPEWFDRDVAYPADDAIPDTAMVILKWLADEFAAPMVCHLHAFASACESGAVRAGEVIDSEHDQPLLAPQAITVDGEHHAAHRAQVYAVWLAQRFQLHWTGLSPHDRATAAPLFSAPSLAALLHAPVGLTLERRDQRFYTQAD